MSTDRNNFGAFVLSPFLNIQFFYSFQRQTKYFNLHCKISQFLSTRSAIDDYRDIASGEIYDQHILTSICDVYELTVNA
jgi:hypothetical protein